MTDFEPPPSTLGTRRKRIFRVALSVAAVLAVAAGTLAAISYANQCSFGIARIDDNECVGVTDGGFAFDPALQDVSRKIKAENDRIRGERVVAVAVAMPMQETDSANLSIGQIRSYLEGAYIAQRNNNRDPETNPKIRLVLANEGSREQYWEPVAKKLGSMTDDQPPLVAVTGLGLSSSETVAQARELARSDLPMVAYLSADELNSEDHGWSKGPIDGLTRVTPSLREELEAIASVLRDSGDYDKPATLVYDRNSADLYSSALYRDFNSIFGGPLDDSAFREAPYDGTPGAHGIANQFTGIAAELCGPDTPDTVLFAGRAALLPDFVRQLRQRSCTNKPIRVITGSDSAALRTELEPPKSHDAPVSIIWASVSDPTALENKPHFERFEQQFTAAGFDPDNLENGWAIMAHDALLTAVRAIQGIVAQGTFEPGAREVRGKLYQLTEPLTEITGASGTFTIDQHTGDRVSESIPVIELPSSGAPHVLGTYRPN